MGVPVTEYLPAAPDADDLGRYGQEKDSLESAGKQNTPEYAVALTNWAACLGALGDEEAALRAYSAALIAHEAAGSTDTPSYADTVVNVGDHLNELGRHREAMELFAKAREIYQSLSWENTLNNAVVLHNMGLCAFKQGKPQEAMGFYREAQGAYESILLGAEAPQYAELLRDMEEAEDAELRPLELGCGNAMGVER
ncbi:hypothetical protein AK812_SmicGene42843 [Symbiodinium microadriaticum]|uniref:Uncharacterized protein n=1 Tax=Symbiodinium microadriaticum TaxID=2951 RepID=A0A1Q9C2I5_SYMMI|nr:hypothetical protein AK812_SmicGene42843 [Symbiodinium microadriaticum]